MAIDEVVTRKGRAYAAKIRGTLLSHGAVTSGPFQYEETVTGGTSGATGVVLYQDETDGEIIVGQTSGATPFQNSETLTGGTSGATATADAAPTTAYHTDWITIPRLRSFNVNSSRSSTPIIDMDTDETEFVDKVRGNKEASSQFGATFVPNNEGFQIMEAAYNYDLDVAVRRTLTTRDGSTTRTKYYVGGVNQFNESDDVEGATAVDVGLDLSDNPSSDPTT